jgi:hypothetical protein
VLSVPKERLAPLLEEDTATRRRKKGKRKSEAADSQADSRDSRKRKSEATDSRADSQRKRESQEDDSPLKKSPSAAPVPKKRMSADAKAALAKNNAEVTLARLIKGLLLIRVC